MPASSLLLRRRWLYTICAYFVIAHTSALWMTVAGQAATIGMLYVLSTPLAGDYQSPLSLSMWINNIILSLISAVRRSRAFVCHCALCLCALDACVRFVTVICARARAMRVRAV